MPLPPELLQLAARQHGVLTRRQLDDALGRSAASSLVQQGVLARLAPGAYRLGGAPMSFATRASAACLLTGAPVAVSHAAAAALLLGGPAPPGPVSVIVPPGRSGRRRGVAARRLLLADGDVVHQRGIPVTSPVRTLVDLSSSWSPAAIRDLADRLSVAKLITLPTLAAVASAAGAPAALRAAVLDVPTGPAAPGSVPEVRLHRWLVGAGLPAPVPQHRVVVAGSTYLLDLAYPQWMVAIEYDGLEGHGGLGAFHRDRHRITELQLAGWLVVLVTARHGRTATVDRVERALRSRGWAPGA